MKDDVEPFYLFSYFKGHGDGLHLAWSGDGFIWTALGNDEPFIVPCAGPEKLMRDPFLLAGHDELFHLVWTAGWHGSGIGYASSPDLISWSEQKFIPVMAHEKNTRNCWAPEIFYDDIHARYIVYWASSVPGRFPNTDQMGDDGLNHRIYYTVTRDFRTFSQSRLFFDGGFNVIDATLVKDENRYVMFMKDETLNPCAKNIRMTTGSTIFDGFKSVSPPISGAYWAEGPTALKIEGDWIVYFDKYKVNEMGAVCSRDLFVWEDISEKVQFPRGAQHGAAVKVAFERVKHLF
jgi:hypothetical protein